MITSLIAISSNSVIINGEPFSHKANGSELLKELYKDKIDYPKFYKMDALCKLGFVASELLLQRENGSRFIPREDRAVILFNKAGSLNADKNFQNTISDSENYFPSPSLFVYTLPNIVTGEIAIRNKYYGETSFYILPEFNADAIAFHIENAFQDEKTKSIIGGWIDCKDKDDFEAVLFIVDNKSQSQVLLSKELESNFKQINS